ncbi:unnamed protein product [Gongylonema pulchrum]|uniref:Uncharacterized protein n=1 Tax=Gongylonema pulchrum TaxID=637853 RepID=A0A183E9C2_9BILA|nr:unnamed protein product [Gongylonema pulchrum]
MNIRIGLHNTVCFRLENDTSDRDSLFADVLTVRSQDQGWLHTLTLSQLEHHHPISQQYEFAIPEVRASCICECDSSSDSTNTTALPQKDTILSQPLTPSCSEIN